MIQSCLSGCLKVSVENGGQGAFALPFLDEAVEDLEALYLLSKKMV